MNIYTVRFSQDIRDPTKSRMFLPAISGTVTRDTQAQYIYLYNYLKSAIPAI
jgi:hypothetical protein